MAPWACVACHDPKPNWRGACGLSSGRRPDSGFAKTILLVEPVEPFLGTVRLDGLPYQNVDLKNFYPYGEPKFPLASS